MHQVQQDPQAEEARCRAKLDEHLGQGKSCVLFTSRTVVQEDGQAGLGIGLQLSETLCSLVQSLKHAPRFLIAKGGITSNDVAVKALKLKRATVLGCVRPGVPVWRCGPDSLRPGLAYVVFPGNVGQKDDLAKAAAIMAGKLEQ